MIAFRHRFIVVPVEQQHHAIVLFGIPRHRRAVDQEAYRRGVRIVIPDGQQHRLFGHGRLAQTLLENGLIDELRLSIHPVLAGAGLPQFTNGDKTRLTLVSAKTFTTGVVVLSYQTAGA